MNMKHNNNALRVDSIIMFLSLMQYDLHFEVSLSIWVISFVIKNLYILMI